MEIYGFGHIERVEVNRLFIGLKKREYGDVTGSSIVLNCVVWGTPVYIKLPTLWSAD